MAITQEGASTASEPPAAMVARSESAGRLIFIAIGWCLLTGLISGVPVGFVVSVLKHADFQNLSSVNPIPATVMVFLAGCTLLIAVRRRSVVVGHGNRRAGVDDRPITRWWLLLVLAFLAATWAFVASAFWNAAVPQWVSSWRGESPWTLIAFTMVVVILAPFSRRTLLQRLALDRAPTTLARISDRVIVMQPLAHRAHRPRVPGANNSHSDRSHSGFRTTLLRY
jgi:hypothetical protein